MNSDTNHLHQPDTEFTGELQVFSGVAVAPNDPKLEPRIRIRRPIDLSYGPTGEVTSAPQE